MPYPKRRNSSPRQRRTLHEELQTGKQLFSHISRYSKLPSFSSHFQRLVHSKILIFSFSFMPILSIQRTKKRTEELSETTSELMRKTNCFLLSLCYIYPTILKSFLHLIQSHKFSNFANFLTFFAKPFPCFPQ